MNNLLIIATYFPPMPGIGTVRVTKYVKYLRNFGWQPTVVTVSNNIVEMHDDTLLNDIDNNVEIIKLALRKNKLPIDINFYKALKNNIDKILNEKKYNAFFITGGPFEEMRIAPYIKKHYKIPYVIDLRDPWKLQQINFKNKLIQLKAKIKKRLIGKKEKKFLNMLRLFVL